MWIKWMLKKLQKDCRKIAETLGKKRGLDKQWGF